MHSIYTSTLIHDALIRCDLFRVETLTHSVYPLCNKVHYYYTGLMDYAADLSH